MIQAVWAGAGDRVAATALVFQVATAGAGGVAADVGGACRRLRGLGGLGGLGEAEVAVEAVESDVGFDDFADGGALQFDEFHDFHGRFEAGGW